MTKRDFDAVVVGSGPNGLAAAITLQQAGLSVLLLEGKDTWAAACARPSSRCPAFAHDICSAIHPLAAESPFFKTLPLAAHGLEYIYPPVAAAHPFDNGTAAAAGAVAGRHGRALGADATAYHRLLAPVVRDWPGLPPTFWGRCACPGTRWHWPGLG